MSENKAVQEHYKSTNTKSEHRGVTQPKVSTKKTVALKKRKLDYNAAEASQSFAQSHI